MQFRHHGFAAAFSVAVIMAAVLAIVMAVPAAAHNPIFTPGPHVTYQGGIEVAVGYERDRASGNGTRQTEQEVEFEIEYGITADWTVEMQLPFLDKTESGRGSSGIGDMALRTRYRFWRLDSPGVQDSAAVLLQVKLATGDADSDPRLGSGSTDVVGGLLYGHEGRRWYYNLAARYRLNTEGEGGLEKGDRQFLDAVGGVRPVLTGYLEPDTVLFLEFNWENAAGDDRNGAAIADTGGWELFVSPGVFWTWRNVAVRGGVQIPIAHNLEGARAESDYRFKLQLKYQF
jgi:hypothetical protein